MPTQCKCLTTTTAAWARSRRTPSWIRSPRMLAVLVLTVHALVQTTAAKAQCDAVSTVPLGVLNADGDLCATAQGSEGTRYSAHTEGAAGDHYECSQVTYEIPVRATDTEFRARVTLPRVFGSTFAVGAGEARADIQFSVMAGGTTFCARELQAGKDVVIGTGPFDGSVTIDCSFSVPAGGLASVRVVLKYEAEVHAVLGDFGSQIVVDGAEVSVEGCGRVPTEVIGRVVCESPDSGVAQDLPVVDAPVEIEGVGASMTGANGEFVVAGSPALGTQVVNLLYSNLIGTGPTTELEIADELNANHRDRVSAPGVLVTSAAGVAQIDLGTVRVSSGDCELWRIGREAILDYHGLRGEAVPGGRLGFLRRSIASDIVLTFYNYIDLGHNILTRRPAIPGREWTIFHEFGHLVRDVLDGGQTHWDGDNTNFIYARCHVGREIFEEPYAFHEGWASYWAQARRNGRGRFAPTQTDYCAGAIGPRGLPLTADHTDWVEFMVADHLLELADCRGDDAMVEALERNPGTIHSLSAFEAALCSDGVGCCGLERGSPAPCPPQYSNDGEFCRLNDWILRSSYGRGLGTIPTACPAGQENSFGLCYPSCPPDFDGVGPLCLQDCPSGYNDDGLFCRRDVRIITSDNSRCEWFDICGLFTGCSRCPPGFQNDGCFCRIDADIFAKRSFGRGAGTIPNVCPEGRVLSDGLCYPPCNPGDSGIGPLCYRPCPPAYRDLGVTCYLDLHVIRRYPPQ